MLYVLSNGQINFHFRKENSNHFYQFPEISLRRERLIVITGQRGTGKTTMLLQRLKESEGKGIYLSLDDIGFEVNRHVTLIEELYSEGYR